MMAVLICRRQLLYLKQKSLWASRGRHYRNFASGASGCEYAGLKSWGVASERTFGTPRTKVLGWWYGPYRAGNGSEHPRTSKSKRSSGWNSFSPIRNARHNPFCIDGDISWTHPGTYDFYDVAPGSECIFQPFRHRMVQLKMHHIRFANRNCSYVKTSILSNAMNLLWYPL